MFKIEKQPSLKQFRSDTDILSSVKPLSQLQKIVYLSFIFYVIDLEICVPIKPGALSKENFTRFGQGAFHMTFIK